MIAEFPEDEVPTFPRNAIPVVNALSSPALSSPAIPPLVLAPKTPSISSAASLSSPASSSPPVHQSRLVHRTPSIHSALPSSRPYPSASAPPHANAVGSKARRQEKSLTEIRQSLDPFASSRRHNHPSTSQPTGNTMPIGPKLGPPLLTMSSIRATFDAKVDAAQYSLQMQAKEDQAEVAKQMAKTLQGVCDVCIITCGVNVAKDKHPMSFRSCGRPDFKQQFAFMKSLAAKLRAPGATPYNEYCWACLLPGKPRYASDLHTPLDGVYRHCEFNNLVYNLVWLVLQNEEWYSLALYEFPDLQGIQRMNHKAFIDWASQTEMHNFCNALRLALWFWMSVLENGQVLNL
jgi:hypothetical protein